MATNTDEPVLERELVLTRRIAAPRALVFRAWTDPEHLMRWWGPKMFTTPECQIDLRPGGALLIVMQDPAGQRYPMTGQVLSLDPPRAFSFSFTASHPATGPALEGVTAIVLTEQDGQTELTVTARARGLIPEAAMMLSGMQAGWSQSLDRLADLFTA
ncbi:MAG TPA: SRPBCC domain-containing protein [Caulobacteraceae bacterium]|nr:SRPBCC domain-containing protein [Caulobacteraceae bacterium]